GALCHLEWKDRKINLVDTPGDTGFQADTFAALRVVEGVVVVLSGVMGVEVNTARVWQLSDRCVAIQLPIGSEHELTGIVDLLHMCAYMDPSGGREGGPQPIPDSMN